MWIMYLFGALTFHVPFVPPNPAPVRCQSYAIKKKKTVPANDRVLNTTQTPCQRRPSKKGMRWIRSSIMQNTATNTTASIGGRTDTYPSLCSLATDLWAYRVTTGLTYISRGRRLRSIRLQYKNRKEAKFSLVQKEDKALGAVGDPTAWDCYAVRTTSIVVVPSRWVEFNAHFLSPILIVPGPVFTTDQWSWGLLLDYNTQHAAGSWRVLKYATILVTCDLEVIISTKFRSFHMYFLSWRHKVRRGRTTCTGNVFRHHVIVSW